MAVSFAKPVLAETDVAGLAILAIARPLINNWTRCPLGHRVGSLPAPRVGELDVDDSSNARVLGGGARDPGRADSDVGGVVVVGCIGVAVGVGSGVAVAVGSEVLVVAG